MRWKLIEALDGNITDEEIVCAAFVLRYSAARIHNVLAAKMDDIVAKIKQRHKDEIARWESDGGSCE